MTGPDVALMQRRDLSVLLTVMLLLANGCGHGPVQPADRLTADEHNDLGVAYYARGEYGLAAREFRRATTLRPGWARALTNLGDAQFALGELEAAIDAYEAAFRMSPDDAAAANNLAWALLQHAQRWREAEALIRGALARNPEPRGYYLDTLGFLLLKKNEPREALRAFRAALADTGLRSRPTRALVLRHTGEALARLGDSAAAERCDLLARELTTTIPSRDSTSAGNGQQGSEVGRIDPVC